MPIGRPNASRSFGVLDHHVEQLAHPADRAERHQQPLPGEVGHDHLEAGVLAPEQVLLRHLDVGERELAGVGGVPAELLELRDDLVAGRVGLDDEERDPVVAAGLGRLHRADEQVGADAVGDERLRAVDDVAAVDLARERPDRGDVGAGAGLGDPERADLLAGDRRAQEALVLVGGAELEDRRRRDPGVGAEPGADPARRAAGGELLGPDGVVDVVAALAAELLRVLEAEEAELGGAVVELAREQPLLLPLGDVRRDLGRDPAVDRLAQLLVLVGERRQDPSLGDRPSLERTRDGEVLVWVTRQLRGAVRAAARRGGDLGDAERAVLGRRLLVALATLGERVHRQDDEEVDRERRR